MLAYVDHWRPVDARCRAAASRWAFWVNSARGSWRGGGTAPPYWHKMCCETIHIRYNIIRSRSCFGDSDPTKATQRSHPTSSGPVAAHHLCITQLLQHCTRRNATVAPQHTCKALLQSATVKPGWPAVLAIMSLSVTLPTPPHPAAAAQRQRPLPGVPDSSLAMPQHQRQGLRGCRQLRRCVLLGGCCGGRPLLRGAGGGAAAQVRRRGRSVCVCVCVCVCMRQSSSNLGLAGPRRRCCSSASEAPGRRRSRAVCFRAAGLQLVAQWRLRARGHCWLEHRPWVVEAPCILAARQVVTPGKRARARQLGAPVSSRDDACDGAPGAPGPACSWVVVFRVPRRHLCRGWVQPQSRGKSETAHARLAAA